MTIGTVWWLALLSICAFAMPLEAVIRMPSVASAAESRANIITHTGENNSLQQRGAQSQAEIDQVTNLINQAEDHLKQRRYAEAEPLYKRALAIIEKAVGPNHPVFVAMLNKLATLYREQGKYAEAEPLYRRALEIREKALGPDHPEVGTNLLGLANLYKARGNYAEAESLFKRAMGIFEKKLDPNDPRLGTCLMDYADLLHKTNRDGEAAKLETRAAEIRAKAAAKKQD
jgi:tetratricopeptide (TPR) repeat protein